MADVSGITWWKDFASAIKDFGTVLAALLGGIWAYWKFGLGQERYPHIETSADIKFIGKQGAYWIVELIAFVENKGSTQHRMYPFDFKLSALHKDDEVKEASDDGQLVFPHLVKGSSFLGEYEYFAVDAKVKAKYSYVTKVSVQAIFVILQCTFKYGDKRQFFHTFECTKAVPELKPNDVGG